MAGFLFAMLALLATGLGGRDQLLIARLRSISLAELARTFDARCGDLVPR